MVAGVVTGVSWLMVGIIGYSVSGIVFVVKGLHQLHNSGVVLRGSIVVSVDF